MDNGKYIVKVFCENCGDKRDIEIEKGVKIEDYPCSSCGVRKLSKQNEQARMIPRIEDCSIDKASIWTCR